MTELTDSGIEENHADGGGLLIKISFSKKKVARFFSKPEKNSYGEPPEINCTWLNEATPD